MADYTEGSRITEYLTSFGLSRQEAVIYETLLKHGDMTGYEVSKETGISRSNVYASISALTAKGAAYLIQGEASRYTPVEVSVFVEDTLENLRKKGDYIIQHAPEHKPQTDGYITIQDSVNIQNKIRHMLIKTEHRVYMMASSSIIEPYLPLLADLKNTGKKVVILTDSRNMELLEQLAGTELYVTETEVGQIRLITDSAFVLTGELTGSENDTCLYSGQLNLVTVMKEALKNKITILKSHEGLN